MKKRQKSIEINFFIKKSMKIMTEKLLKSDLTKENLFNTI